jgi:hypothetical protein
VVVGVWVYAVAGALVWWWGTRTFYDKEEGGKSKAEAQ